MQKILIATWGLPWNDPSSLDKNKKYLWKEALYVFNNKKDSSLRRTTLPLLLEELKPNTTFIFVQDTVAVRLNKNIDNYYKLCEIVKEAFYSFVKEMLSQKPIDNINIKVLPGVGKYSWSGSQFIFQGRLKDYYSLLLYELYTYFRNNLIDESEIELILDASHGLNYTHMLTHKAIVELGSILALIYKTKFTLLNSEPVLESGKEYIIHEVESSYLAPPSSLRKLNNNMFNQNVKNKEYAELLRKERFAYISNEELEELNTFSGSIINGLPLALSSFYPINYKLNDRLESCIKYFTNEVRIHKNNHSRIINRNISLSNNFDTLVMLALLSHILKLSRRKELIIDLDSDVSTDNSLTTINKRVYKRVGRIKALIATEYRNLLNLSRLLKWDENITEKENLIEYLKEKIDRRLEIKGYNYCYDSDNNIRELKIITEDYNIMIRLDNNNKCYLMKDNKIIDELLVIKIDNDIIISKYLDVSWKSIATYTLQTEDNLNNYLNSNRFERNFLAHVGLEKNLTLIRYDKENNNYVIKYDTNYKKYIMTKSQLGLIK